MPAIDQALWQQCKPVDVMSLPYIATHSLCTAVTLVGNEARS